MHIILFDTDLRESLLPFTYTRPVCELRLGILTIREKWQRILNARTVSYITPEHLEPLYPIEINVDNLLINGAALPTEEFKDILLGLQQGEALMQQGELIAARLSKDSFEKLLIKQDLDELVGYEIEPGKVMLLDSLTAITAISQQQIGPDMQLLVPEETALPSGVDWIGDHSVFIHPQARVERVWINATEGPVYIGQDAHIMDGARLRGPVAIGQGTVIKGHALLSKGVCVGPFCEIGGEVKQSVFLGYSNKSHEGYIGDSVIGEWCNLGALTTNSNLRNTFSNVNVWDYGKNLPVSSGMRKCGFFMGDYSRTSILTRINSGTVIGVSCHIFGEGITAPFVPSFSWGGVESFAEYDFEKAFDAITVFRSFKNQPTGEDIRSILTAVLNLSAAYRKPLIA